MSTEAIKEMEQCHAGDPQPVPQESLRRSLVHALGWTLLAIASLYVSYTWNTAKPVMVLYLFALLQLAHQSHWRLAFYPGLAVGVGIALLHLNFFWTVFSIGAVALWIVFGFWIALFVALARLSLRCFGGRWGLLAVPFLWMGLEYFRSELYYLRFSWVTPGFAFATPPWSGGLGLLGVYGIGFLMMSMVCASNLFLRVHLRAISLAVAVAILALLPQLTIERHDPPAGRPLSIAGVQMEFPDENEVMIRLREILRNHPATELIVLSEYTFDGPVPQKVRDWCADNRGYLVVGGKEPAPNDNYFNTAYVIGPEGQTVFQQVKTVPIQFMKDGLPAVRQQVWASPWGRIGICICYDLSYSRVTDALVKQGAELLIVPTMDVIDWGKAQHELHARVAPARAAEYGVPIFRLASSGISQYVDRSGRVLASAPCPGEGALITAEVAHGGTGRLPLDRWLAPASVGITGALVLLFLFRWMRALLGHRRWSYRSSERHSSEKAK